MIRSARATLMGVAVAVTLAACAADPTPTYLAVQDSDSPALMSMVGYEAVLSLSEEGCWGAGGTDFVFPKGTTIQPDGSGIVLDDGFEIELGDHMVGGSGASEDYSATIPEQCDDDSFVFYPTTSP